MKTNRTGCLALAVAVFALLVAQSEFTPVLYAQPAQKKRPDSSVPDSVKVERDIVYAKYGKREVKLDLYLLKKPASERIPCIVVITGGGWTSGDKTRFAAVASHLADRGFAAACIDYRLLPEVEFPAPVMDCNAAVRWVRANAAKHGIDPDRIGAMGGSAGGHLAAMLGTSHNEPKLEGDGGNPGVSSRVQAVVGMATPTDMTRFADRTKLNKEMAALVSPVTHVSKESAPLLLLHGTKDGTVPMQQSELLLEKYKKAGASAELVKIPDGVHAFWNFEQWFDDTMKRSVEFFGTQFGTAKPSGKPASKPVAPAPSTSKTPAATDADNAPPVCYDITKTFPREVGHYRVTRAAKPVEPFEILDGLYYVGNTQVGAHLLKSTDGLILFDSTMPHEVPWLLESIRKLGFKPSEVKVVVGNHSHVDHIGGHWYFQKHFGAQTWLQVEDAAGTEAGIWQPGKLVELDGTIDTLGRAFPPFKTDRLLRDGEVVEWGGRKMTFHRAPGHTPGTLMIEFPLQGKDGKTYRAGMLGGLGRTPEFTATCKKLREVPVDVWLGAHPDQNRTLEKAAKLKDGKGPNTFIDPEGWKQFLDKAIGRDKKAKSQ